LLRSASCVDDGAGSDDDDDDNNSYNNLLEHMMFHRYLPEHVYSLQSANGR
jgi:predicted Zn-dependent peptidase